MRELVRVLVIVCTLFYAANVRADDTILLGLAGPISGNTAIFGEQMKRGAEQAVADINAAGGLLGHKIELKIGDDAGDPKQGVAVANQLASQGVIAVIGHFNSNISIPASLVYHDEGMVQITPASTNPALTEQGFATVFRICGRDDKQGVVAAKYILKHFTGQRVAIIHDKSAYGKGLAEQVQRALNAADAHEVMFEAITPGEKDYTALVSRLKNNHADLIYYGGYHPEAALIVRQSRQQGYMATLLSGDALASTEFLSITGKAGDGTLFTFEPDWRKLPSSAALVEKFRAAHYEPEGYVLNTYAAFQLVKQAVDIAHSLKPADIARVLHDHQFDTVLGKIAYDAKGDIIDPKYVFYEFNNGSFAELPDDATD